MADPEESVQEIDGQTRRQKIGVCLLLSKTHRLQNI